MNLFEIRQKLNMGYSINNLNLRVTYYSRVSTDHLEQKKSLKNQNEHFDKMIKENNNWEYIAGYVDDGISGTSDIKRNSFMQMIEDAKKNKFDLIITKEISRFSRNTLVSIKYTRELLNYGVAVLFLNDNINTILPDSELRLTIMASMAQDEIRRLSERVKFGMHRAQENGELLGNNMLYGYQKKNKRLIIIKEEAKVIKSIFNMYVIDDLSLSKISKELNDKNIKTKQNKKWNTTQISRIISNPKYKGYYCGRKKEVIDYMTKKIKVLNENEWITYKDNQKIPPIINEYIWNKANDKIKRKEKKKTSSNQSIYTNKIYCSNHDKPYYKKKFRKNNIDTTWICKEYLNKGKKYCDTANIRESELNIIMEDIIKEIDKRKIKEILINIYKNIKNKDKSKEKINDLNNKITNLKIKKNKLLDLSLNNIISNKELEENYKYLNNEIKKLEKEINSNNQEKIQNIEKKIKEKLKEKEINSLIIPILIDKIIVSKKNNIIILKISININKYINKKYEFKRGYDTKNTSRYIVKYLIECYYKNR